MKRSSSGWLEYKGMFVSNFW